MNMSRSNMVSNWIRHSPMVPSETIGRLCLLAVLRKIAPEGLMRIYHMGAAHQEGELKILLDSIDDPACEFIRYLPQDIPAAMLQPWLQLILEPEHSPQAEDLSELGATLRECYLREAREKNDVGASDNEVNLFRALAGNCNGKTVCDPAAGLGLCGNALQADRLLLQEYNKSTMAIGAACFFLENKSAIYKPDSSLAYPAFINQADVVVMTPPYGMRLSASERESLPVAPFYFPVDERSGPIPSSAGESLWVQIALACAKESGKAYILLPPGWFFRSGYDARIRGYLLDHELVESVVAMPMGTLRYSNIGPSMLILNKGRPKGSPIFFVDASKMGMPERNQLTLLPEHCAEIADLAQGRKPDDARFIAVHLPDIRKVDAENNTSNTLSVSMFIKKEISVNDLNFEEEKAKLNAAQAEFEAARDIFAALLRKHN